MDSKTILEFDLQQNKPKNLDGIMYEFKPTGILASFGNILVNKIPDAIIKQWRKADEFFGIYIFYRI